MPPRSALPLVAALALLAGCHPEPPPCAPCQSTKAAHHPGAHAGHPQHPAGHGGAHKGHNPHKGMTHGAAGHPPKGHNPHKGMMHGNPGHGGPHGHKPLVHRFEKAEDWVARFEGPERDKNQRPQQVIDAMKLKAGDRVADIGTGTGYFISYLSAAVGPSGEVVAADIEPNMIRYVKARAAKANLTNVSPRLVLGDDPLLADNSFNRLMIVNTWHHIPGRIEYGKKLLRALKQDGALWVIDFTREAPHGPPVEHRLPPQKVVEELTAAGFSARVDTTLLPHQYVVIGTRPTS